MMRKGLISSCAFLLSVVILSCPGSQTTRTDASGEAKETVLEELSAESLEVEEGKPELPSEVVVDLEPAHPPKLPSEVFIKALYLVHKYEDDDYGDPVPDLNCGMHFNGDTDNLEKFIDLYVEASHEPAELWGGPMGIGSLSVWNAELSVMLGKFKLLKEEGGDEEGSDEYGYWVAKVQCMALLKQFMKEGVLVDGKRFLRIEAETKTGPGGVPEIRSIAVPVVLDASWPQLVRLSPPPGERAPGEPLQVTGLLPLAYKVKDPGNYGSGVVRLEVLIAEGYDEYPFFGIDDPAEEFSVELNLSLLEDGEYDIVVRATDCVGNVDWDTFPVIVANRAR